MANNIIFKGAATALITPFKNSKEIDYNQFASLIDWQIDSGIDALVVCGTSGEASTLTDEEHKSAISFAVKQARGRVPIIAGTGSNDTAYAVELSKYASDEGADALLIVTPYYNKATQKGLINMYNEIADSVKCPLICYNVPSRTGVNIEPSTYLELSKHPNINAIKEANGNISKIADTALIIKDKLNIYSGNDDQIIPILSLGGIGVISVLSNLFPKETSEMCKLYFEGKVDKALELQLKFLPIIHALFCEVNPIPVKCAMKHLKFCDGSVRGPLTEMEAANEKVLVEQMRKLNLNV
ncbi:MAG: 4-hydroxy-tetrahydrodipicolinate synthase [Clostridia bacterium]|nr:4-hydroxy-tetrahydrodipicolinate synthase [Clostridia bacterium]